MYWYKEGYDLPDHIENELLLRSIELSNSVLVIGPSGSGKTTSLRNLDFKETFYIGILDKPLPFRGYKKHFKSIKDGNEATGNFYISDDWIQIIKCIKFVNDKRPDIKTLVIDDFNYLMANEFMRRASEKGYDRFTEISLHAWNVINEINSCRPDLMSFVLSHSDLDQVGKSKCKTVGKLLDDKITVEGLFTIVLHTKTLDGQYQFLTQSDNECTAKSPMEMFDQLLIDNDLAYVKKTIEDYYNEGES